MTVPGEKIVLFIDGANLYATAKSLGFDARTQLVSPVVSSIGSAGQ